MDTHDLIGLGSYSFRYAARIKEKIEGTLASMDAIAFVEETARLGLKRALICENLNYCDSDETYFKKLAETAVQLGITIEVGMKGVSTENLIKHINIAKILGAKQMRIVLGDASETLPNDLDKLKSKSLKSIRSILPILEEADLYLGIENHFDLAVTELVDIVSQINNKRIGFIYDTTNCIGLLEKPLDVLHLMKEHLFSVHLKDYECRKTDAGYFFSGADLGEGSLDIAAVIKIVRSYNPDACFILEYSMKPVEKMSDKELLDWERERVTRNVAAMLEVVQNEGF